MTAEDAHNLTEQCDWFSEENRTKPRITERLDAAGCLFLSLLPYSKAVPVLILVFVLLTLFSLLINGLTLFGLGRSADLSLVRRVAFFRNLILNDLIQTVAFAPSVIHSLVQRWTMAFSIWFLRPVLCGVSQHFLQPCHHHVYGAGALPVGVPRHPLLVHAHSGAPADSPEPHLCLLHLSQHHHHGVACHGKRANEWKSHQGATVPARHSGAAHGVPSRRCSLLQNPWPLYSAAVPAGLRFLLLEDVPGRAQRDATVQRGQHRSAQDCALPLQHAVPAAVAADSQSPLGHTVGG